MTQVPLRGQVYRANIVFGAKPWLVVSNNQRNRALADVLAVRITTTDRYADLPTWVALTATDPLVGFVNTDDLQQLHRDEGLRRNARGVRDGPAPAARSSG